MRLIEEEFVELADALFPGAYQEWVYELRRAESVDDDMTESRFTDELAMYPESYNYAPDLVEVADALGDLDVVVNGAGIRHGFDMQAISREVFASNMTKLGADGRPVYRQDGKIEKGPNFRKPNLARVLGFAVKK